MLISTGRWPCLIVIYYKFDKHKLDDFDPFQHVSEQKKGIQETTRLILLQMLQIEEGRSILFIINKFIFNKIYF